MALTENGQKKFDIYIDFHIKEAMSFNGKLNEDIPEGLTGKKLVESVWRSKFNPDNNLFDMINSDLHKELVIVIAVHLVKCKWDLDLFFKEKFESVIDIIVGTNWLQLETYLNDDNYELPFFSSELYLSTKLKELGF